jgi:hypothetical protein
MQSLKSQQKASYSQLAAKGPWCILKIDMGPICAHCGEELTGVGTMLGDRGIYGELLTPNTDLFECTNLMCGSFDKDKKAHGISGTL